MKNKSKLIGLEAKFIKNGKEASFNDNPLFINKFVNDLIVNVIGRNDEGQIVESTIATKYLNVFYNETNTCHWTDYEENILKDHTLGELNKHTWNYQDNEDIEIINIFKTISGTFVKINFDDSTMNVSLSEISIKSSDDYIDGVNGTKVYADIEYWFISTWK